MKATIQDVAQAAGVSTATVSRVFSRPERVSEKTRQRVLDVAEKLNFYVSRSAGMLKSGKSMRIALLVGSSKIDWFSGRVIEGLNTVFRESSYDLVIYPITSALQRKEFFKNLPLRGNVDAVIISSFAIKTNEIERLHEANLPIIGVNVPDPTGYTASVSIDDYADAALGVKYLVKLGHTHIDYCMEPFDDDLDYSSVKRIQGFTAACEAAHVEHSIISLPHGGDAFDVIYPALMMPEHENTTAIFFHQDSLAVPFIFKAQRAGLKIPQELSVLGFDNSHFSGEAGLTTIKQTPLITAMKAAHKALALINGDMRVATHDIESVQLLIRSSTAHI